MTTSTTPSTTPSPTPRRSRTPRRTPSHTLRDRLTRRSLATLASLALVPLAAVAVPAAPAVASDADPVIITDGGPVCLDSPGGAGGTGTITTDYTVPAGAVGVRAFLRGHAGGNYNVRHRDYGYERAPNLGGRGAELVVDVPAAEGTTVFSGLMAGGAGGVPSLYEYTISTGPAPGGDAAFVARASDRCNSLVAVAAGGGGAGGGTETNYNGGVVTGSGGGNAGVATDGSGAQNGFDGAGNSAKDGAGGLAGSLTGAGRGGARGTNWKSACADGNHGSAGSLFRGGKGGDAGPEDYAVNCAGTGGGGGGGAGLYGGGGGGSSADDNISGGGGGGSSWVSPSATVVSSALSTRRDDGAPRIIPIYQPTVGVTASASSVAFGAPLTLTARLGSLPADSRGYVIFLDADRNQPLTMDSTGDVVNRTATYTIPSVQLRRPLKVKALYVGETDESSHINLETFSAPTAPIAVGKEALPVTVTGTQVYGGAPTFTRTVTAPAGVTVSGSVECLGTTTDQRLDQLDVGSYTLASDTCSGLTLTGANAGDYALTYTGGALSVTKASLAVRVDGSTSYGGTPVFSARSLPGGLSIGDVRCRIADGTPLSSSLPVGSYPLAACTGLQLGGPAAGNYTAHLVPGTLYVLTDAVVVSVSGARTWDAAVEPFSHTVQGSLPAGTSLEGTLTCRTVNGGFPLAETDRDTQRTVGAYTIDGATCSGLRLVGDGAANHQLLLAGGPFTVRPRVVPVVLTGGQQYGGDASFVAAPAVADDLPAGFSLQGQASCSRADGRPLGELTVRDAAYALDGTTCWGLGIAGPRNQGANFRLTYTGTVRVAEPSAVEVKVDLRQDYGGTPRVTGVSFYDHNPDRLVISGEATCANVRIADGVSPVAPSVPIARDLTGGTQYPIDGTTCSGLAVNAPDGTRFPITYGGTLSVHQARLTVTAPSTTRTYRGDSAALVPVYSGFVLGQSVADLASPPTCRSNGVDGSTVGHFAGALTCSGGYAANYAFTYVAGDVTVTKRPLTVTAPDRTVAHGTTIAAITPNQLTYDGFAGGYLGENWSTALDPTPTCTIDAAAAAEVGTHPGAITCAGASSPHYEISYVAGALTVTGGALAVTAPSPTKVYGAALPALVPTYAGFAAGDDATGLARSATCTTTATATSPVGDYPVTCSGAAMSGYATSYVAGTLEVVTAPLTVTAQDVTTTYGGTSPAVTPSYDGFVGDETAATALTTRATCTASVTPTSRPGTYATTCSGTTAANYVVRHVTGTATVTPRTLTMTAPSPRAVYGAALPALLPSYAGFVGLDSAAAVTTAPTCSTPATVGSPAGTYPVTCSGATAAGYDVVARAGTLTVTPAPLTVTASGGTSVFGRPLPTSTPSYDGFVLGDTAVTALQTAPTCGPTLRSIVRPGRYDDGTECADAVSRDYAPTYVSGVVTVTPAELEVAAPSPSAVYGQALPALVPTYDGLVADDVVGDLTTPATCTTTATATSPVGTYAVTCADVVTGRYDTSYVAGTLSVTPASLTIRADDVTATHGRALPAVTPTYVGLVHGETAAALTTPPTCSATLAPGAAPGVHPGAAACASAVAGNYTITYVAGDVLLVEGPSVVVTGPGATITRGETLPALVPTITGAGASDFTTAPTCTTTATSTSPAGDYAVRCAGGVAAGFTVSYAPGTITVLPAAATTRLVASAGGPVGPTVLTASAGLSGVGTPTGSVTFTLHGPGDTDCSGIPVATSTVALAGGEATSAPFTPVTAGAYRWATSYAGDTGHAPSPRLCAAGDVVVTEAPVPAPLLGTRLTGGPGSGTRTTATSATFTYVATGGQASGFECSLDAAAFAPCAAAGTTVRRLDLGVHTFRVRALNADGVADASAALVRWRVLEAAPTTRVVRTTVTGRSATFQLGSSATAPTYECRLDGGAWRACGPTPTFRGLSVGAHVLRVRATNGSGVTDASPALARFRVRR